MRTNDYLGQSIVMLRKKEEIVTDTTRFFPLSSISLFLARSLALSPPLSSLLFIISHLYTTKFSHCRSPKSSYNVLAT